MKKNLFKVLFGLSIFAIGLNVHAAKAPAVGGVTLDNLENGEGSTYGTVVVGDVATPVYMIDIYWDDLTFDWIYDKTTEEFNWKPASLCQNYYVNDENQTEFNDMLDNNKIFTDSACSTVAIEATDDGEYYYVKEREYVHFSINDLTENGKVVPSLIWNSADNYEYVNAVVEGRNRSCMLIENEELYDGALEFGMGVFSDSACNNKAAAIGYTSGKYYTIVRENYSEVGTGELSDSYRESWAGSGLYYEDLDISVENPAFYETAYSLRFKLENTSNPVTIPQAGDSIGTLTVLIRAK